MSFMRPEIWNERAYHVETTHGTEIIPESVGGSGATLDDLADYLEGTPLRDQPDPPELVDSWLARLSAPGYMDCTDTTSHETEAEAIQYLLDTYDDQDEREDWSADLYARLAELGGERRITITYEIVMPESAEQGDIAESGWEREDGVNMAPDAYDLADGLTAARKAANYLVEQGATEPSGAPYSPGTWYTDHGTTDYRDGLTTTYHYHLVGYTEDEQREIYRLVTGR